MYSYNRNWDEYFLSFIERCPLFGVYSIESFTVNLQMCKNAHFEVTEIVLCKHPSLVLFHHQ